MEALQLLKFKIGVLDEVSEFDDIYLHALDSVKARMESENGIVLDENNPYHLDFLVDMAAETLKIGRDDLPIYLLSERTSLALTDANKSLTGGDKR